METRSLATILVAFLNAVGAAASEAAGEVEKLISAEGDGDEGGDEKPARRSRAKAKASEEKPARTRPSRAKSKDEDEDDDDADEDDDGDEEEDGDDEPSEDDVIDAVRAAQKVLPRDEVVKLVKKFGKAERSRDVKPENRRHLIVNLEKAIKNAEED